MTVAADCMFGLETEYAFSALGANGEALDRGTWVTRFMDLAMQRLPNLPDKHGGGVFLETGGRFYRDSGNHPELTTPEVVNPWDLCRYVSAGDRALRGVVEELAAGNRGTQVVLSRHNVSYGPFQSTWACHESYSHRAAMDVLPRHLIPHLVTRIVYTGAGGFNNRSAGIEFLLSPRVAHIHSVQSDSSQSSRGIYHTKDETLNDKGYHRLHILCGESVCSERSNWLKMATTALVVAMIEAGLNPAEGLYPQDPVVAMHRIAADPVFVHRFRCSDGRKRGALDVQRQLLELASRHAKASFMPEWTEEACCQWRHELDLLTQGADAVSSRLDWAIKLRVFKQAALRLGIEWNKLPAWNQILAAFLNQLVSARIISEAQRMDFRALRPEMIQPGQPLAAEAARLEGLLQANGLDLGQFPAILTLRQQLFQLDTRFSEVSSQGVFASLDAAGVLDHHVPGVDNVDQAVHNPPSRGRARLRGECVKQFFSRRAEYTASWVGVWNDREGKFLNLSDPFRPSEEWTDVPRPVAPAVPAPSDVLRNPGVVSGRLTDLYSQGDYGQALQLGEMYRAISGGQAPVERAPAIRMLAFVQARVGLPGAFDLMQLAQGTMRHELPGLVDTLCLHRFYGLVPDERFGPVAERCLRIMADFPERHPFSAAAFKDHYSAYLLSRGRLDEAREILEPMRSTMSPTGGCTRVTGRMHATLAELDRRQGRFDEAHEQARRAREMQTRYHHPGDLAEFAMAMEARLDLDQGRRLGILRQALVRQRTSRHTLGEARTLLLMARVGLQGVELAGVRTRLSDLQRTVPALTSCALLRKLFDHWNAWTTAAPIPGAAEYFAGV